MVKTSPPTFSGYPVPHRERLRRRAATREWEEIFARGPALAELRDSVRPAPEPPGQMAAARDFLLGRNAKHVRALIASGERDEERLLARLGDWESALAGDDDFPLLFLGLVPTLSCSFVPRCVYCNQVGLPRRLSLDDFKAVLDEAMGPIPPYVYVTGGEPLLLAAEIWGDSGLVAHATERGAAVNLNTNAALITPAVALRIVATGTAKIHVSLDTPAKGLQDELFGRAERAGTVLAGIENVQIAREALGARHPRIHVNCVLTTRNLFTVPDLLRFVLGMREEGAPGDDFALHLVPVGGTENSLLRPDAAEWKRFYTDTWAQAEEAWNEHQALAGVPADEREGLADAFPFTSPWHRVAQAIDLDEYCRRAARGDYWQGALSGRCYVGPTQAYVLPDGSQHWCGAHAISRPPSLGDVREHGLRRNIRRNASHLAALPNDTCRGCAGATCAINQATERALRRRITQWIAG